MSWIYNNKFVNDLNDFDPCVVGFVYKITNLITGKFYIGKKILRNKRKVRISKKEKKLLGTRKTYKYLIKESDWKDYYGSSKTLKEDIKKYGKENFSREILELCHNKKYMTYAELSHQIRCDVLKQDTYNENIISRFFKKDVLNICQDEDE